MNMLTTSIRTTDDSNGGLGQPRSLGRRPFLRGVAVTAVAGSGLATLAGRVSAGTNPCFDVISAVTIEQEHFLAALLGVSPCLDEGIRLALYDDLLALEDPILLSVGAQSGGVSDSTIQEALATGLGVAPVHEGGHVISDEPGDEEYRFHFPTVGVELELGSNELVAFGEITESAGGGYFALTDIVDVTEE